MMILIWIALGGALGSVLRYLIHTRIDQMYGTSFPLGILSINIIGSFLMGALAWLFASQINWSESYRVAVLVGLLGGFTTFSSFSNDTLQMLIRGEYISAGLNVVLSVVLCIIAAGAGLYLAKSI